MSTSLSTLVSEGVLYPTQGTFQSSVSVYDLEDQGIRYVRIQWVDLINNIRCRVVPLAYFKKLLRLSRPGISVPKVGLGIAFLTVAEGFRYVSGANPNDHVDNNHCTSVSLSVLLANGYMLWIYLRSGYVHMLLDMPA